MKSILSQLQENGFVELTDSAQLWTREGVVREAIIRAKSNSDSDFLRGWEGDLSAEYYLTFHWVDASEVATHDLADILETVKRLNAMPEMTEAA